MTVYYTGIHNDTGIRWRSNAKGATLLLVKEAIAQLLLHGLPGDRNATTDPERKLNVVVLVLTGFGVRQRRHRSEAGITQPWCEICAWIGWGMLSLLLGFDLKRVVERGQS